MRCSDFSVEGGDTPVIIHPLENPLSTCSRGAGGGAVSLVCRGPESQNSSEFQSLAVSVVKLYASGTLVPHFRFRDD